jgi:hypothetical protein
VQHSKVGILLTRPELEQYYAALDASLGLVVVMRVSCVTDLYVTSSASRKGMFRGLRLPFPLFWRLTKSEAPREGPVSGFWTRAAWFTELPSHCVFSPCLFVCLVSRSQFCSSGVASLAGLFGPRLAICGAPSRSLVRCAGSLLLPFICWSSVSSRFLQVVSTFTGGLAVAGESFCRCLLLLGALWVYILFLGSACRVRWALCCPTGALPCSGPGCSHWVLGFVFPCLSFA